MNVYPDIYSVLCAKRMFKKIITYNLVLKNITQLRFAQGYENTMPLTIYKFSLTCAYICSYLPLHKTTKMLVQNAVVISTIGQELALKKRERKNSKKDCVIGLSVHMLRG